MALASAETPPTLTMKLLVDTTTRRVVFAETIKAAVDYLHSLLESNQVVSLDDATMAGCVHNLYNSVDELAAAAARVAHTALWPALAPGPSSPDVQATKRFFNCGYNRGPACGSYVAETLGAVCPSCGLPIAAEVPGAPGAGFSGAAASVRSGAASSAGSAPPAVTCILMDDLTVMPMDGHSLAMVGNMTTTILRNIATVQEINVQLGVWRFWRPHCGHALH